MPKLVYALLGTVLLAAMITGTGCSAGPEANPATHRGRVTVYQPPD
jgi:hypothetical protein